MSEAGNGVAAFVAAAEREASAGTAREISDAELTAVLTAAVRLFGQRAEYADAPARAIDVSALSTTEVLTAACEMIRQINVNMFDVQLWFSRGER